MKLGTGIAITGIWIGTALTGLWGGDVVGLVAMFAFFATVAVAACAGK